MLLKRIISIAAAAIAAAAMLISLTACGKENVVNTDEGKKLTAHAWQTNYTGHSEVTFQNKQHRRGSRSARKVEH